MKHLPPGILLFLLTLLPAAFGDAPPEFDAVRLSSPPMKTMEFNGEVQYARTLDISFEQEGRLDYVIPVGSFVRSEVLNTNGEVVRAGELLARQDIRIPGNAVRIAEAMLKRAAEVKARAELKFKRKKALKDHSAASEEDYEEAQMSYNVAVVDHQKAALDLYHARQSLIACHIYAPFNGIIDRVYSSRGASMDIGDPVLRLCMIDPAKVVVTLPEDFSMPAGQITKVLVYPHRGGAPAAGWFGGSGTEADKIEFYLNNPRFEDRSVTADGRPMPVIDHLSPVREIPDLTDLAALWISTDTIRRDQAGCFVWRLKGVNAVRDATVPSVAPLEKVRVELTDNLKQYGIVQLRGVKAGSTLANGDFLAGEVPDETRSGDIATYRRRQYRFRIRDKVRVQIYCGDERNIFPVPAGALVRNADNAGYFIWLAADGRAEKVPVNVVEQREGAARIFAARLKEGELLLLPGDRQPVAGEAVKAVERKKE